MFGEGGFGAADPHFFVANIDAAQREPQVRPYEAFVISIEQPAFDRRRELPVFLSRQIFEWEAPASVQAAELSVKYLRFSSEAF